MKFTPLVPAALFETPFVFVKAQRQATSSLTFMPPPMLRLASISGSRDPYVIPSSTPPSSSNGRNLQLTIPAIKEQLQVFIGALSPRTPRTPRTSARSSDCYEYPELSSSTSQFPLRPLTRLTHQQSISGFTSISNTRELAFGAFDDAGRPAVRKKQKAYRRQCAGRVVFTLIVFAVAIGVFVLRLKISQQEQRLRDHWKVTNGYV